MFSYTVLIKSLILLVNRYQRWDHKGSWEFCIFSHNNNLMNQTQVAFEMSWLVDVHRINNYIYLDTWQSENSANCKSTDKSPMILWGPGPSTGVKPWRLKTLRKSGRLYFSTNYRYNLITLHAVNRIQNIYELTQDKCTMTGRDISWAQVDIMSSGLQDDNVYVHILVYI